MRGLILVEDQGWLHTLFGFELSLHLGDLAWALRVSYSVSILPQNVDNHLIATGSRVELHGSVDGVLKLGVSSMQ